MTDVSVALQLPYTQCRLGASCFSCFLLLGCFTLFFVLLLVSTQTGLINFSCERSAHHMTDTHFILMSCVQQHRVVNMLTGNYKGTRCM